MRDSQNKNSYNLVLLGNTMISRLRREIRRFDPFSKEAMALRPVVQAVDDLRVALSCFDQEWRDESDVAPRAEAPTENVLTMGFQNALKQMNAPEEPLVLDEDEPVDQSAVLGYRGGPYKVPDVMLHLSLSRKTGTLRIKGLNEIFDIEVADGDVINAFSNSTPKGMRLGEVLVDQGAVDQTTLDRFLDRNQGDRCRLGEALKAEELVTQDQLVAALTYQFQALFMRCFRMKLATITFKPDCDTTAPRELRMDVVSLLMEGSPPASA